MYIIFFSLYIRNSISVVLGQLQFNFEENKYALDKLPVLFVQNSYFLKKYFKQAKCYNHYKMMKQNKNMIKYYIHKSIIIKHVKNYFNKFLGKMY